MFSELYKYLGNPSHCNQYLLMAVPEGVQLDSLNNMYNCDNTTAELCRSCDFVTDSFLPTVKVPIYLSHKYMMQE
jgi:hypothetical protein